MSRNNTEDSRAFNQDFQSGKFSHSRRVLVDDVQITVNGSLVNFFDAGGADRIATLPLFEKGRFFVVANVGATDNIIVNSSAGVLVTTVTPGDTALMFASDEEWVALRGWAALGVFTNTINGLVPAPNSVTPGSLFLRDDGQWAQVQVVGIVDAFKYITDGTNTAEGSGPDTFYIRSASGKIGVVVTNGEAVYGDNVNLTVNEGAVDHDALLNFFSNEHIDHSGVVLTAGVGISGGGDLTASRTFDFDPASLTVNPAPVLADYAVMDLAAGGPRVTLWSSINAIFDHNALLNYSANRHIDHTGVSIVVGTGLSGGGDITTSRSINLDIVGMTADTPAAADSIAFYDASAGDHNRTTFATLNGILDHNLLTNYSANRHVDHTGVTLTAGAGLTGGGDISANRTFDVGAGSGIAVGANAVSLDIAGLSTVTPVALDLLPFYDISGTVNANMTITALNAVLDHDALVNFFSNEHIDHTTVSISTTEGIQGGGTIAATRTLKLDINGLTVNAAPNGSTDYVAIYDAASGTHKKTLLDDLPGSGGTTSIGIRAACYLVKSGSNLVLRPENGNEIEINGAIRTIPAGGVSLAPPATTTFYYIYAYWTGSAIALEASTTAPVLVTNESYYQKTGDATRHFVGMAHTTSSAWVDTPAFRHVWSYYNRKLKIAYAEGTGTITASNSTFGVNATASFICFDGDYVSGTFQTTLASTTSTIAFVALKFDATPTAADPRITHAIPANWFNGVMVPNAGTMSGSGVHTAVGAHSTNNATACDVLGTQARVTVHFFG